MEENGNWKILFKLYFFPVWYIPIYLKLFVGLDVDLYIPFVNVRTWHILFCLFISVPQQSLLEQAQKPVDTRQRSSKYPQNCPATSGDSKHKHSKHRANDSQFILQKWRNNFIRKLIKMSGSLSRINTRRPLDLAIG